MSNLFANPWCLLLLFGAALLAWCWLRWRPRAISFTAVSLFAELPGASARSAHRTGAVLRFLGLSLLVIAIAGPRWPAWGTRIPTEGIAVAIVVDVSGSMAEQDFQWDQERITRIEAVKRACRLFIKGDGRSGEDVLSGRSNDQICLITFATRPESPCPLTLSHTVLLGILDAEQPRRVPTESETNIGDAIVWALHKLEAAGPTRKVILLLTDGEHNVPPPAMRPRQAAQIAASLRIPVHVIDVGGKPTSLEGGGVSAVTLTPAKLQRGSEHTLARNKQALQAVAARTGGRYFRADDSAMLSVVCQEIDRLERGQIESFEYRRFYDTSPWFALLSLVVLTTVYVLEHTVWLRIP